MDFYQPSHVPRPSFSSHYRVNEIYRAQIVDVIYPEDNRNSNKQRVEYEVSILGQNFIGVIDVRQSGGIYNYSETIRKKIEKWTSNGIEEYDEKLDGETVLVGFFEGHGSLPVILGSLPHPMHPPYKKASKEDGQFHVFEYNGVEFKIDDSGTIHFEIVGKKDPKSENAESPTITNPDAVGAKISIDGTTGDILIQDSNQNGNNKIEISGKTINITTTDGDVNINAVNANITATGTSLIDVLQGVTFKSPLNAGDVAAGGTGLVSSSTANADPITGIPLIPVPGVSLDQ